MGSNTPNLTEVTPEDMLATVNRQHGRIGELEVAVQELTDEVEKLTREKNELTQAKHKLKQRLSGQKDLVKTLKDELSGEHDVIASYLRGEAKHVLCARHQVTTGGKIAIFNLLVDFSEAILTSLQERQLCLVPDEEMDDKSSRSRKRRMLERLTTYRGTILGDVGINRPGLMGLDPVDWTPRDNTRTPTKPPRPNSSGKSPQVDKELWNAIISRSQQRTSTPLRRSDRLNPRTDQTDEAVRTLTNLAQSSPAEDDTTPANQDTPSEEDGTMEEDNQETSEPDRTSPAMDSAGNTANNTSA